MTTATRTQRPATDKQQATIEKFRTRKVLNPYGVDLLNAYDLNPTARNAGAVLDYLFDASTAWIPTPRPATLTTPAPTTPGLYAHTDDEVTVYEVKQSRTGNLYAMRLDPTGPTKADRWIYEGARPLRTLPLTPLTKTTAAELGHTTGICCCCGATLTNPTSIEQGIGPICGGRL